MKYCKYKKLSWDINNFVLLKFHKSILEIIYILIFYLEI